MAFLDYAGLKSYDEKIKKVAAGSAAIDDDTQVITVKSISGEELCKIDLSAFAKSDEISKVVIYKGSVETYAELPTDVTVGWMYNVVEAFTDDDGNEWPKGTNVVWTESGWDPLAGFFDVASIPESDIEALFEAEDGEPNSGDGS